MLAAGEVVIPGTIIPLHTLAGSPEIATVVLGVVIGFTIVLVHGPNITESVILPFPVAKFGFAVVEEIVVPAPAVHVIEEIVNPANTCVVLNKLSPEQVFLIKKLGTKVTVSIRQKTTSQ